MKHGGHADFSQPRILQSVSGQGVGSIISARKKLDFKGMKNANSISSYVLPGSGYSFDNFKKNSQIRFRRVCVSEVVAQYKWH